MSDPNRLESQLQPRPREKEAECTQSLWETVETLDGSLTLRHRPTGTTYHSMDGAVGEAQYVYLEQSGLRERLCKGDVHLLEIGYGTGLNFAMSIQAALSLNAGALHYTAFEPNPLSISELLAFHQRILPEAILAMLIGKSSIPKPNTLYLIKSAWEPTLNLSEKFDIIYFDAFGSEYAPELWTPKAANSIAKLLRPGGVLVTFGVKGEFRRALQAAGLITERLPGYGRKRHMLRATAPKH